MSGTGAKLFGGRWNSVGVPMHYMAENRSLAALEVLANKNNISDAKNLCLTIFEVPSDSIEIYKPEQLPEDWRMYSAPLILKQIGDEFIKQNKFLLLKVPSVLIEDEFNYLMNVNHDLCEKVDILEVKPFNFDKRLI
ncbi:RES family NAD+ phosphorylase [Pedobacter mucosus]|nr:RES family NAD+ phosphorylase [Pedobacter mucosus]